LLLVTLVPAVGHSAYYKTFSKCSKLPEVAVFVEFCIRIVVC